MLREQLYYETVDILLNAYMKDELQHANCYACAVGNIVGKRMGYSFKKAHIGRPVIGWFQGGDLVPYPSEGNGWSGVFCTEWISRPVQVRHPHLLKGKALEQIEATGYSWQELARIELAFERAHINLNEEDRMFQGLMNVLDKLGQIHEITDEDILVQKKAPFEAHYHKRVQTA